MRTRPFEIITLRRFRPAAVKMNQDLIILVNITASSGGEADMLHPPLGILYVGGSLKKAGFKVKVYHRRPADFDKLAREIAAQNPLFVGFSVLTGLPTYHSAKLSQKIKKLNPNLKIVWGGHHPTLTAEQCLNENYIDIVVMGEGEDTAVELAATLKSDGDLNGILGIARKTGAGIKINPSRPRIKDLDRLEADWSLVNPEDYIIKNGNQRIIGFYSSRGCPYNCGFCSSSRFFERTWRPHSADYVVGQLKNFKEKFGINGVIFADDNFFIDTKRAFEIIENLRKIGIRTQTLDIRINQLDDEVLKRLQDLEATGIFFGWESGNNRLLELMDKGITREDIVEKTRLLAKYPKVSIWASGILGLPTETKEETLNTVKTGLEISKIHPYSVVSFQVYLPFPGTRFFDLAVKEGFVPPKNTEEWGEIDAYGQSRMASWLPWVTQKDQRNMQMSGRYAKAMLHKNITLNPLLRLANNFFYFLAYQRIKHQFFYFPIDFKIYQLLKKWWQKINN